MLKVVAIDVGLINLGYVHAHIRPDVHAHIRSDADKPDADKSDGNKSDADNSKDANVQVEIVAADCVDITILRHNHVHREQCRLFHSADACDRVTHFIQEHKVMLRECHYLLIERQPIQGLNHVEQLLFAAFRNKAVLCPPQLMHRWLGIHQCDRAGRKRATIARATPTLEKFKVFADQPDKREHMSDALCILLWWVERRMPRPSTTSSKADSSQQNKKAKKGTAEWFGQFAFTTNRQTQSSSSSSSLTTSPYFSTPPPSLR